MKKPGSYWDHIEQAFSSVSIYEGQKAWLNGLKSYPPWVGDLLAAHWTMSEVLNGGFRQFFLNSTGVVAPQALDAFRHIGLTDAAGLVAQAMSRFGPEYPLDRRLRSRILSTDKSQKRASQQTFSLVPRFVARKLFGSGQRASIQEKPQAQDPFEELEAKLFMIEAKVWKAMDVYAAQQSTLQPAPKPSTPPPPPNAAPGPASIHTQEHERSRLQSSLAALFDSIGAGLGKEGQAATAEFRAHLRQVRAKAPDPRITLVRTKNPGWLSADPVRSWVKMLEQEGFQPAGAFKVGGNDQAVFAGFSDISRSIHATLVGASGKAFLSFGSTFEKSQSFECTDLPVPFEPPRPAWQVVRRCAGLAPRDLLVRFLAERPKKPLCAATPSNFVSALQTDFQRYQAWLADRGGATREELRARYGALGKLPKGADGEEMLDRLRADEVEQALGNWWRLQPKTPLPWANAIESLVIIHDDMSPAQVANAYWCATDDFHAGEGEFSESKPREAFERALSRSHSSLRRVLEKRTGLAADYYLPAKPSKKS